MQITDFIPVGHENGVTAAQISSITGISQRQVREMIAIARHETIILNMQDGEGYFIPDEGEEGLTLQWVLQEEARLKSIGWALKAARKAVRP